MPPPADVSWAVRAGTESSPAWSSCWKGISATPRHAVECRIRGCPALERRFFAVSAVDGEPFRDTVAGGSSVRLRIFNDAAVDSDTLDRALKRVTAIYAQIRVRLRWTTTHSFTDDGKPLFDIVITNSAPVHAETTNSITRAVYGCRGSASISAHRAHAFYGRIRNAAVAYRLFKQERAGRRHRTRAWASVAGTDSPFAVGRNAV